MKQLLLVLLLGVVVFSYADVPIYGYFWTRYTFENPTTPEVDQNENYFSIERGYIRWKTKTKPVSLKATIDIAMKSGATAKSDWRVRLKYAHADWTLPGMSDFLPGFKAIIGLQKVYFGVIDKWNYPTIQKAIEDAEKVINSADLGLGFHGYLPSGYGTVAFGVCNGSGYTHPFEDNQSKDIWGDLVIIPYPGITLKGSAWLGKDNVVVDTLGNTEEANENRYAGVFQVKYGPVKVIGEFLYTQDGQATGDDITGMGYMGFAEVDVTKCLSLVGRYDYFDPNSDADNNSHNRMIGGLNWTVSPTFLVQVNYEIKTYEDDTKDSSDKIMAQFKYTYKDPK